MGAPFYIIILGGITENYSYSPCIQVLKSIQGEGFEKDDNLDWRFLS